MTRLRVWHIPQIPGHPFHVEVASLSVAKFTLSVLARYDQFQLDHNIKGDYANVQGLEEYVDYGEGPRWYEWNHPDTGEEIREISDTEAERLDLKPNC